MNARPRNFKELRAFTAKVGYLHVHQVVIGSEYATNADRKKPQGQRRYRKQWVFRLIASKQTGLCERQPGRCEIWPLVRHNEHERKYAMR